MTVSALNYKKYDKGSMLGFFDLEFHGMTVKGCRLMSSNNGSGNWIALPQKEGEKNGERQWFDILYMTPPLSDHVRGLVLADLQAQGHLEAPARGNGGSGQQRPTHRTPEGEDVSEYYTQGVDDDIPF